MNDFNLPAYRTEEIPVSGMMPGITYVVTKDNIILWTREYTRHIILTQRAHRIRDDIAWGGILDAEGNWVRKSFDFGDAPTREQRDRVTEILQGLV